MRVLRVDLIGEFPSPDAIAALACARRVAPLHHETFDVAVELRVVIIARGAKSQEVEGRAWNRIAINFNFDVS